MRAGDFAGLPVVYDPLATAAGARQPLAGNRIPAERLDTVATTLLARVSLPNLPGLTQNLRATEIQRFKGDQYNARLDHQLTARDSVYLRGSLFDAREFGPFGSSVLQESLLPGFGRNLSTHAINGAASWSRFYSSLTNELRVGFLTVSGGQTSPNAGNNFAAVTGLQGVTSNPLDAGYPQISFGGEISTMGDPALFTFRRNHDLEFYDNLAWHKGRHTVKGGVYLMHYRLRPVNPNGSRGVFSFTPRWTSSAPGLADGSAFADFLLGYPTTAQVGLGRAAMDAGTEWAHFYLQESWQVTPRFRADFGVRYEYNRNMTESNNEMAAIDTLVPGGRFVVPGDANGHISPAASGLLGYLPIPWVTSTAAGWDNSLLVSRPLRLAPRAGLAWNPAGCPKTVLRAGAGIYPNQAAYSIVTNLSQNLPFFVTRTVNSAVALSPVFNTSNALATNSVGTVGGSNLDHNFRIEYNEVWNASVEREFGAGTTVMATYIGSRTVAADSATVLNVAAPGPGAIASRRPIPQMAQISDIRWNGWAAYQAFGLSAKRRFSRGLMFDLNWTWSHSIDDASDPGPTFNETNLPQNVADLRAEKASSSFDHRNRVVVSFVYDLPVASRALGWKRLLLANWRMGANFTAQSGAPFTVNIASDQANIGSGPAQRPNAQGNPNRGPRTPERWFDTAVFSLPALYSFGNAPRNAVIGPPLQSFDVSLHKELNATERLCLRLSAEAYNLFNHPNFNIPGRTAFAANFGSISSAQDSRQLQLALRLEF